MFKKIVKNSKKNRENCGKFKKIMNEQKFKKIVENCIKFKKIVENSRKSLKL